MNQPNGELTDAEREAIARLPREAVPPPELEDETVRALAARSLLRLRARRHRAVAVWAATAAAAVLLFAAGFAIGSGRGGEAPVPAELPRFALLLYEGPEYRSTLPGYEAERVREYSEWAAERGSRGEIQAGEKLSDGAELVLKPDGAVLSRPPTAGGTRLAGFFLVRAADHRSALEIARSCPHARYGGSIVIRRIDPT